MPGRLWCAPGRREAPGLPGRHLPRWQPAWVGQVDLSTGAAWSAMPSVATRLVGVVDFYTGAAWSAMPSVATRLIGVILDSRDFVIFLKNLLYVGLFLKKIIPFVLILLCPDGSYHHHNRY